jgi:hypothetical protein
MTDRKSEVRNRKSTTSTKIEKSEEVKVEDDKEAVELTDLLATDPKTMDKETKRDYEIVKALQERYLQTGRTNNCLCQVFLNRINEINSATQSALIDIGIQLLWIELDAIGEEGDVEDWKQFKYWKPQIEIMNDIDMQPVLPDGGSYYIRSEYSKYGIMNWYQRYKGNIRLDQDLREFPFDRQTVKIKFGCTLWSADVITLVDFTPPETKALYSVGMNFTEWELVSDPKVNELVEESIEDHREISYLEVEFNIRRKANYYLTHVVFLVYLINVMCWTVFTIGSDVSDRLSLDITLFLALVALNFVVIGFIPKVSYPTTLSNYFVVSYAMITLATLHNVVIYFLSNYYCDPNSGADPFYPPDVNGTIVTSVARCWTALFLDWAVLAVMAIGMTIFTLVFTIKGMRSLPGEIVHRIHAKPGTSIYDDAVQ